MSTTAKAAGATGTWLDERLGAGRLAKHGLRKVFPDHWSFMLGEIALYSFIILLLSGTFLTLWFVPSTAEVIYEGDYVELRGIPMSEAYASTLDISFEVRGGLLMRQIHHWAALIFVASISVHLMRVFFTGAFRKPRELNWVIGALLLILAIVEGFAGYSLPDDLLSGTGLRITHAIIQAMPVIGTWLAFFVFGGEYPGEGFIPRVYIVHVLLLPGIMLALITVHLVMLVFHKHAQWPGPGRTQNNVVGYPLMPVYMAKAGGFFFLVFGVIALMSAFFTINAIWRYGPYEPTQVTAGSQPDWYMGFLDGAVRTMPNWETEIFGNTISWNILVPALVIPGLMFTPMILYPWIEQFVTKDKREHHLLDRPRNAPTRTALGMMALSFWLILFANGGNDVLAISLGASINHITWAARIGLFVVPPLVYVITKRICIGLQRRDKEKVLHGRETGILRQLPHGEFIEVHEPLTPEERWTLTSYHDYRPLEPGPDTDENGVPRPGRRVDKVRARMSRFYFADSEPPATPRDLRELESSEHH